MSGPRWGEIWRYESAISDRLPAYHLIIASDEAMALDPPSIPTMSIYPEDTEPDTLLAVALPGFGWVTPLRLGYAMSRRLVEKVAELDDITKDAVELRIQAVLTRNG